MTFIKDNACKRRIHTGAIKMALLNCNLKVIPELSNSSSNGPPTERRREKHLTGFSQDIHENKGEGWMDFVPALQNIFLYGSFYGSKFLNYMT